MWNSRTILTNHRSMVGYGPTGVLALVLSILLSVSIACAEQQRLELPAEGVFPARVAHVNMVNGKPEGEVRYFTPTGQLLMVEQYSGGVLHGSRVEYYPNGNRFQVLYYERGVPVGRHVTWHPNGNVRYMVDWQNGMQHGQEMSFFLNGNVMIEGQRIRGIVQGRRNHYTLDGRVFGVSVWENGYEVDQIIHFEAAATDLAAIQAATQYSGSTLRDVWGY